MAYYVATTPIRRATLADELIHQVECIITALKDAERAAGPSGSSTRHVAEDELTDRWPANLAEQRVFIDELRAFAVQLHRLQDGVPLPEMQRILEDLFGERPAREAVRKYTGQHVNDNNAGKGFHILRTGSIPALGFRRRSGGCAANAKEQPWGD